VGFAPCVGWVAETTAAAIPTAVDVGTMKGGAVGGTGVGVGAGVGTGIGKGAGSGTRARAGRGAGVGAAAGSGSYLSADVPDTRGPPPPPAGSAARG
jgi:hypothetical protein